MTVKIWALGLFNAFISGVASSIAVVVVDSDHFNFNNWAGVAMIGRVAIAAGVVSLAKYVYQNRIPGAPAPTQGV